MGYIELNNYSNEEYYRHYGTLSDERINHLLDIEAEYKKSGNIGGTIRDAIAQYPDEGFLGPITERISKVAKRVRGRNKDDLNSIIAAIGDLEMTTFYAAEYGISELNSLMK